MFDRFCKCVLSWWGSLVGYGIVSKCWLVGLELLSIFQARGTLVANQIGCILAGTLRYLLPSRWLLMSELVLQIGTFFGACFKCNKLGHFLKDCNRPKDVVSKEKSKFQPDQSAHGAGMAVACVGEMLVKGFKASLDCAGLRFVDGREKVSMNVSSHGSVDGGKCWAPELMGV